MALRTFIAAQQRLDPLHCSSVRIWCLEVLVALIAPARTRNHLTYGRHALAELGLSWMPAEEKQRFIRNFFLELEATVSQRLTDRASSAAA